MACVKLAVSCLLAFAAGAAVAYLVLEAATGIAVASGRFISQAHVHCSVVHDMA